MRTFAILIALGMFVGGCPKEKASPGPASGGGKSAKAGSGGKTVEGKSYSLVVKAAKPVKVGEEATTSITLTPLGEYKVNMEYPLRLTVEGSADSTPQKVVLGAKQAQTMNEKGVVLLPKAKLGKVGDHAFKAELRFSVCTKKHCELKREQLSWVAKAQ